MSVKFKSNTCLIKKSKRHLRYILYYRITKFKAEDIRKILHFGFDVAGRNIGVVDCRSVVNLLYNLLSTRVSFFN